VGCSGLSRGKGGEGMMSERKWDRERLNCGGGSGGSWI
jgi:hypothetical protein